MPEWIIATWNVNSIRTRLAQVLEWAEAESPDVLCLQETKVTDDLFPVEPFQEAGFSVALAGQRTYNGVALVSREPLEDVVVGFPGDPDPTKVRVISATLGETRIINLYVPNGSEVGSEKYAYKLAWLEGIHGWLDAEHDPEQPLAILGDFNIAPEDRDVHDPEAWEGQVLCSEPERDALRALMDWGLVDLFRRHDPEAGKFSWWDYRQGRFRRGHGLRIDLILGTAGLAESSTRCRIDAGPRALEKPSDHAPVVVTFDGTPGAS